MLAKAFQGFPTLRWHGVTFDSISMGAITMTACWIVFIVATFIWFEDPYNAQPPAAERQGVQQPLLSAVSFAGQQTKRASTVVHSQIDCNLAICNMRKRERQCLDQLLQLAQICVT